MQVQSGGGGAVGGWRGEGLWSGGWRRCDGAGDEQQGKRAGRDDDGAHEEPIQHKVLITASVQ